MGQPKNATRTLSMSQPKIETVRFPNGHKALLVHVDQDTPANAVIAALKLPQPNALACLNGGTAELSDDLKADLSRLLADGLAVSPRRMPSRCSLVAPTPAYFL